MPVERNDVERIVREIVSASESAPENVAGSAGSSSSSASPDVLAGHHGGVSPADGSIALGSDHGGFELKETLKRYLSEELGYRVKDVGTLDGASCDYPDYAAAVARAVANGECIRGIMIDGAGIGSAMAANRVPGVLAACCHDISTVINSREHNGANVLTMGSTVVGRGLARQMVRTWLATAFGGDRHERRVRKILALESEWNAKS
jgi:ribose 5-phosphate isomerase B